MSRSVTVTHTTTSTTTTAIICNTGFLKSVPGLLKLFETIINVICVGIVGYYIGTNGYTFREDLFFLLVAVALLITTALMLFACLISLGTPLILPKTTFHYLYHIVGFMLYLSAGLTLIIKVSRLGKHAYDYEAKLAASVLGLVNAVLYLLSGIFSYRTYYGT